jgi:mycofactocin precursor
VHGPPRTGRPGSSRFWHERVNDEKERTVSEPQVLEPTELDPDTAPHGEIAAWSATQQPAADEVLDDDLLVEEISIDGMCGVY